MLSILLKRGTNTCTFRYLSGDLLIDLNLVLRDSDSEKDIVIVWMLRFTCLLKEFIILINLLLSKVQKVSNELKNILSLVSSKNFFPFLFPTYLCFLFSRSNCFLNLSSQFWYFLNFTFTRYHPLICLISSLLNLSISRCLPLWAYIY